MRSGVFESTTGQTCGAVARSVVAGHSVNGAVSALRAKGSWSLARRSRYGRAMSSVPAAFRMSTTIGQAGRSAAAWAMSGNAGVRSEPLPGMHPDQVDACEDGGPEPVRFLFEPSSASRRQLGDRLHECHGQRELALLSLWRPATHRRPAAPDWVPGTGEDEYERSRPVGSGPSR